MCHSRDVPTYDVILFDLDGTLTDSASGILNSLTYSLTAMGRQAPDHSELRAVLGPPLVDTFTQRFGMSQVECTLAIAKYRERYHDVGLFENEVYPGIENLLLALESTGSTLAVATSKPTYSATRILEHFGLDRYFTFIGGADLDGSRNHKSEVIEHTLEALVARGRHPVPSCTVMIGDREHDVRGALAHGLPCIGVLWGYGSAEELTSAGAAELVRTPLELLKSVTG
jgi:phosphoglycolate phosphatase